MARTSDAWLGACTAIQSPGSYGCAPSWAAGLPAGAATFSSISKIRRRPPSPAGGCPSACAELLVGEDSSRHERTVATVHSSSADSAPGTPLFLSSPFPPPRKRNPRASTGTGIGRGRRPALLKGRMGRPAAITTAMHTTLHSPRSPYAINTAALAMSTPLVRARTAKCAEIESTATRHEVPVP